MQFFHFCSRQRGLVLACLLGFLVAPVSAADKLPKLKAGDKLEVSFFDKWQPAVFVEYFPSGGWLTVKTAGATGNEMTMTLPPDRFRLSAGGGKKPASNKPAAKKSPLAGVRKWTDSTGKHKIEAEFVALADDKVTLKKTDGSTVKLALAKLSEADQEIANTLASSAESENPFDAAEADSSDDMPAKTASSKPAKPAAPKSHTDSVDPEGIELKTPDISDAGEIMIGDIDTGVVPADPEPALASEVTKKGILLAKNPSAGDAPNSTFFEHAKALLVSPTKMEALIAYANEPPGKEKELRLERVNLTTGKSSGSQPMLSNGIPLSLSPDGTTLLCRGDNFHIGTKCRLDLWTLGDKELKHSVSFKPYVDRDWAARDVHTAGMMDSKHLYSVDSAGKLTMWQLPEVKAIYTITTLAGNDVVFSPGRKYLAAVTGNGLTGNRISVFESITGKVIAQLETPNSSMQKISFRPDGKQLSSASGNSVRVWDLTTGKLAHDLFLAGDLNATVTEWPAVGYLLFGGNKLVDLEKRVVLWDYSTSGEVFESFGGQHWYVMLSDDRKQRGLFHLNLPHSAAKKVGDSLNAEELLAIKPGTEVALTVNVALPEPDKQKLVEALQTQLTNHGLKVVPQAKITFEAKSEKGKSREIDYRGIGFGGGGRSTATVTETICTFTIREGADVLWTSSMTQGSPHFLNQKEGQSIQQAVDDACKPNAMFYTARTFPRYMARPGKVTTPLGNFYGSNKLTGQGVQ